MGEDLAGFWKTRHGHVVSHEGALIQFQQGQIVAARQLLRLESLGLRKFFIYTDYFNHSGVLEQLNH